MFLNWNIFSLQHFFGFLCDFLVFLEIFLDFTKIVLDLLVIFLFFLVSHFPQANALSNHRIVVWVIRPESARKGRRTKSNRPRAQGHSEVVNPYTAKRRDVLENTPPEALEISQGRGFCIPRPERSPRADICPRECSWYSPKGVYLIFAQGSVRGNTVPRGSIDPYSPGSRDGIGYYDPCWSFHSISSLLHAARRNTSLQWDEYWQC